MERGALNGQEGADRRRGRKRGLVGDVDNVVHRSRPAHQAI